VSANRRDSRRLQPGHERGDKTAAKFMEIHVNRAMLTVAVDRKWRASHRGPLGRRWHHRTGKAKKAGIFRQRSLRLRDRSRTASQITTTGSCMDGARGARGI
jgi:hypothetical protein